MRKPYIFIILGVLVLLTIGLGLYFFNPIQKPGVKLPDKARNLPAAARDIYEQKLKEAQGYLNTLDTKNPNYNNLAMNTYMFMAQQYFGLGKLDLSKQYYEKALALDNRQQQLWVGLAEVQVDAGEPAAAQETLKKALEINPEVADIWLRYITLSQSMGMQKQDIEQELSQALEKTKRHADILIKAAQFYEQQGNAPEALKYWKEALERDPGNALIKQEIQRLEK